MANYISMKDLVDFLHIPSCTRKHWAQTMGWGITKCLHKVVLERTREVINNTKFVSEVCICEL
jgi:hypothetical protein